MLGAGTGLLGVAAAEAGNLVAGRDATLTAVTPPGETLMYEHGVLKRVLLVYQCALTRLDADLPLAAAAVRQGAQIIHNYIEGFHEALEEAYVFPALQAAHTLGPTVDTLLTQHARGREITQLLLADSNPQALASATTRSRLTAAVIAFVRMYEPHEAREDTIVFPAYRSWLDARQLQRDGQTFLDLQTRQFGPAAFSDTVAQVAEIEQSLSIYDLNQFTPAAELANPAALPRSEG